MSWKICIFVAAISIVQIRATEYHLVAWENSPVNATLTGKPNSIGQWSCNDPPDTVIFHDESFPGTNATFYWEGVYNCQFTTTDNEIFPVTIRVENSENLPLMQLSEEFLQNLLQVQYHYFVLSHRFLSHNRYLPNVSKFFKGLMKTTADTTDIVVKYILAKYVTTSQFDGSNPPNYVKELFDKGFSPNLQYQPLDSTENLTHAFEQAFENEKRLVDTLTFIGHNAVAFEDYELEEFVIADLVPPMLKRLKMLQNHVHTVRRITQKDAPLAEYLYDRQLS